MKRIASLLPLACLVGAVLPAESPARAEQAAIIVSSGKPKGKVNRDIFGSEIKCFAAGQGLMTGLRSAGNEFRPEVMKWVKGLGPTFMRYKFIRGSWNWEDGIGPMAGRADDGARQKYMGVDELMAFQLEVVGHASTCHLVVNPRDPQQSAALVAYLNVPADDPGGNRVIGVSVESGKDYKTIGYWAGLRARHGHPEPYGARWFEIGNENYNRRAGFNGDPHAYCARAREVVEAMKAVDPTIMCGLNMEQDPTKNKSWRPVVIREGGPFADFFVCHAYYPFGYPRNSRYVDRVTNMEKRAVEELYYKMVMAGAHQALSDLRWFRDQTRKGTPRADEIRLCLTENGFHLDVHDSAAQNAVLVGVYDADLIGMMVEYADELKLDNANLFYLQGDDPWCYIQHRFSRKDDSEIRIRPPYWSLFMWTHYFGERLLTTSVQCGTFDIPMPRGGGWPREGIFWSRIAARKGIPLLAAHSSLSEDGETLYLVVVNRDLHSDIETRIDLEGFSPAPRAEVHILNTSVKPRSNRTEDMFEVWDSNNERKPGTVRIRDSSIGDAGSSFRYTFQAHSATAIVLHGMRTGRSP